MMKVIFRVGSIPVICFEISVRTNAFSHELFVENGTKPQQICPLDWEIVS
jgi:hypothetical protein